MVCFLGGLQEVLGFTAALQGSGWTFLSLSDPALHNLFQRHKKHDRPQPDGTGFIYFSPSMFIVIVVGFVESGLSCLSRCIPMQVLHLNLNLFI